MAEVTDDDVKFEFVRRELMKHGEWLKGVFLQTLTKYHHRITGELMNSISFKIEKTSSGQQLSFTFLDYGRFFDIAAYEGHKKKHNDWTENFNKAIWGIGGEKKKRARILNPFFVPGKRNLGSDGQKNNKYLLKTNKWYARTMYGGIGKMCAAIMYDLTSEEVERLKSELKNNIITE